MAVPAKKRQRLEEESDAMQVDSNNNNNKAITMDAAQAKETLHSTISSLTIDVERLDATNPDAAMNISLQLLKLKRLQRRLLASGAKTGAVLKQQAEEGKKLFLRKQNLEYQQKLNEAKIEGSSGNESTTAASHLYKLAASASASMDVDDADPDKTIAEYLNIPQNWQDPNNRLLILETLNQEMTTRQDLQKQLQDEEKNLTEKRAALHTQQKSLKDLPKQIAAIEKASLPLQQFFQTDFGVSAKTGSKRLERMEQAKQLPKAMYTLYHTLQSTLDFMAQDEDENVVKESLPTLELTKMSGAFSQSSKVILTFGIPTVADNGSVTYNVKNSHKVVTVTFQYDNTKCAITASCKSKDGSDMDATLIGELFPGDIGDVVVASNVGFGAPSSNAASAYQWSNYLGGIYICASDKPSADKTLPTSAAMQASSKAIIKALIRRVRASATLSHLISTLFHKEMIVHPAVKEKFSYDKFPANINLSSWTLVPRDPNDADSKLCRVYEAVLKDTTTASTLKTKVRINMARYPSAPPVWDLTGLSSKAAEPPSLNAMPLYGHEWEALKKGINYNIRDLVVESDETTYEWILAHQLWELARQWGDEQEQ
ncbi:MAG: hypothetical protein SGILL_004742 [Bacillariaceae sp.]